MFQITIAFRCENGKFCDKDGLVAIAEGVIYNMRKNPMGYYKAVKEYVRPMTQREAGLHFNIDNCGTDTSKLKSIFLITKKIDDGFCYRIRFIAENFWKLDFVCRDAFPFRINSDMDQLEPDGMMKYKRHGIRHDALFLNILWEP